MQIRRWLTAYGFDKGFVAFYNNEKGAKARQAAADGILSYMRSVSNPKYHSILLPKYDLGAKRAVVDHGYLEATNRDNFTLIKCNGLESVEGVDGRTLVDKAGNRHEVDIVILANGFKTQDLLTPMSVHGLDGRNLREIWQKQGGSEAYMG
jgi:cation diffusion facilitator CzcD-associated flavoprotein CzcO